MVLDTLLKKLSTIDETGEFGRKYPNFALPTGGPKMIENATVNV